ncbi:MAG: bifunctional phosphopantothenoylcysteine decarboxylase/phosphopantothenate--cysteine ligase CoaBC [Chitinophagaceae bacterium]|nr:bifunctional phosphopantothenoylcysteine decarboxylase/phosphopantothenate--cysteine ligase CoaBC [Chitinophagaceae bacterium]
MLKAKKILLCVTGSIAAYKAVYLLRLLQRDGASVRIVMTKEATNFVSSLTFSTLSKERVLIDFTENDNWENHALLGRWADLILIAPASCNTIALMAHGICNNLLQAVYLSATCPVMLAPAMDEDMWKHPATQRNIQQLIHDGIKVLDVAEGELASGLFGKGRMIEPEEVFKEVIHFFSKKERFVGKKILVTAGPTVEPIDPVRFISNHSSGKMGVAIADAFVAEGGVVTLVHGPMTEKVEKGINEVSVQTAQEMYSSCLKELSTFDIIVMAAAVADYSPAEKSNEKIKKTQDFLRIDLKKTPDILAEAGKRKKENQILIGFALETENGVENALKKLDKKNADFIILNSLRDQGAGFGKDTNKISIFGKKGFRKDFPLKSKRELAYDILNLISQHP